MQKSKRGAKPTALDASALIAKRKPVIEAIRAEDRAEGIAEGMAGAVIALLAARGVSLDRGERDQVLGERDPARLERWIARAITCTSAAELLAQP